MIQQCKLYFVIILICISVQSVPAGVPDTPFIQEYHEAYVIGKQAAMNDVRAITVDRQQNIWAATRAGVFQLDQQEKQWKSFFNQVEAGPAFDITMDEKGVIWAATWNGLYRFTGKILEKIKEINQPVSVLCAQKNALLALGPDGFWALTDGKVTRKELPYSKNLRAARLDQDNGFWIATGMGLYHQHENGFQLWQTATELLSADIHDLDYALDGSLWIGGLGGVTIYKNGKRAGTVTPAQGLPCINVQAVERSPDGTMWVGTNQGIARFNGENHSLRHSRRWLVNDDVRDIAFDSAGTAWIATRGGVSAIKRRSMTLAEKADYYLDICLSRHVRAPYLVAKCRLLSPGDTSNWEPRDDDNDGQYTNMYLVMESFRYAVTKDAGAKANAKKAFDAMKFLQTVTETDGFVARTVIPDSWTRMANANRKISPAEWADIQVKDPRNKQVEKRWRLSKDGKWRWKGDTSSDEITGHAYGYLFYHDLVADEIEKKRVAQHVAKVVDYLISGGYELLDIDGKSTRWGIWSPEKLNHDPDWAAERGINSVEILSYLKLAYHVTGNERYQKHYLKLLNEHNYRENVKQAKTLHPSWRTHIDDELLALAFPCLLQHEKDPNLQKLYRESFEKWYAAVKPDKSPYFNFIYGAHTGAAPQLPVSIHSLRDASLDLVRWRIDNSRREDLRLVHSPEWEMLQTSRLLPPSERGVIRWDNNPWEAVQGDGGHSESDGVWWLLPYWMGRYYGFIGAGE